MSDTPTSRSVIGLMAVAIAAAIAGMVTAALWPRRWKQTETA